MGSRPALPIDLVLGHPKLHKETLSRKKKEEEGGREEERKKETQEMGDMCECLPS